MLTQCSNICNTLNIPTSDAMIMECKKSRRNVELKLYTEFD